MLIFVSVLLFLNFPVASCEPINPGCSLGMADAIFQDGDVLVGVFLPLHAYLTSPQLYGPDIDTTMKHFLCLYTGYIQISINM
uniref:Vomeronasal 2, receptor 120 n=2 Tax=Mus musculus TaxID=10090 RepID=A0A3Q4L2S4_MOUSE